MQDITGLPPKELKENLIVAVLEDSGMSIETILQKLVRMFGHTLAELFNGEEDIRWVLDSLIKDNRAIFDASGRYSRKKAIGFNINSSKNFVYPSIKSIKNKYRYYEYSIHCPIPLDR